ncbi:MAG: amidohydrolase [Ignavibacteria bacterium GWA2_55_11]|nr:MAG: amidohydrolase [Ignavibacteria bacterium GWA2_55_11]OGU45192.1 MAG: amidohydrolase [Ignavibacteria bacterium GWC2_56_12]
MHRISMFAAMAICCCARLEAQDKATVIRGALIYTVEGAPIDNGVLIVRNGKIVSVGPASTSVPSDAVVVEAAGKVILPGLVDTHSHIGGGSGGDRSSALQPDVRILDAVNPRDESFKKALAGGITTVNVMPGSGHLMSGQTVYLKLRPAPTIEGMLFVGDPLNDIAGGMKMANGTNPIGEKPFPGTRAKSAALARALFVKAIDYKAKIEAAKGNPDKMPKRELDMEAMLQVLDGRRIVHHHTHRSDDIITVLRLQKEFGFRLVLQHVTEAYLVAKEIADAKIPCSIIVIDSPGGKQEAIHLNYENGAVLEKAGVLTGFHTDDGITDSRLFLRSAAFGVRGGMTRDGALRAVTINNAKMLDLDGRVGSLKAGKDADFLILSGDPFSVYTHVEQTWIEGKKVWDRSLPDDYKYAVGGYEVYPMEAQLDACAGGVQ